MELGVGQDGCRHQFLLHGAKGLYHRRIFVEVGDPFVLVLFGVLYQRGR